VNPYLGVVVALIGVFGFAALYHFVLWSQSRRDALLLVFALHCSICTAFSASLVALTIADTIGEGQRALDLRVSLGLAGQITAVWLLSLLSEGKRRGFAWVVTCLILAAVIANTIVPLAGTVTQVERISAGWASQWRAAC
jgi:hypothetical protein